MPTQLHNDLGLSHIVSNIIIKDRIMKKILTGIIFILIAVNCQPQIPATVTFQEDTTAIKYHIFVWEGDVVNNPLVEDSSYTYVLSLGLTHFELTATQLVFQTAVNGNYIMVAGFNENSAGMTAGATLSNLVLKANQPNKMLMLNLTL